MAKETKHKGKDSGREETHAKERKTINLLKSIFLIFLIYLKFGDKCL